MKYNVYIYGAGNEYNRLSAVINKYENILNVLGVVTTEPQPFKTVDGYSCFTVDEINIDIIDYIIIASVQWKEIMAILRKKGIEEHRIIRSKVFFFPNFNFEDYIKLKHSNVTILSNYCLGGSIYNELGLKMLSPTINMFCAGKDYIEFLKRYEYYLKIEMKEYFDESYIDGSVGNESFYPKGILDNRVVWKFNHNTHAREAVDKWNERSKRVNFNNIAVIMTIQCDEDAYEFETLNFDKKIGVYYKDLGLKDIIFIDRWDDESVRRDIGWRWPNYANKRMRNTQGYTSPVNWIKFLNGQKDYRRYIS